MKPEGILFDSEWRKSCNIEKVSITEIDVFIKSHYLGKRPAICLLCLAMIRGGIKIGGITYSAPPREADKRYGGVTWELSRLFLLDEVPKNAETWLIAQSIKYIKKNYPNVFMLLSYADPSAGHSGTIYKAANWKSDGKTDEGRKSPRCDYFDANTGKKYGRKGNIPEGVTIERRPRISKHRFIYPLK